jgi:hypothetical protein
MFGSVHDVYLTKGIHVMNNQTNVDVIAFYAKIAPLVSNNDSLPKLPPLSRSVELLIDPTIETERLMTDFALQRKVFESLFECFQPN